MRILMITQEIPYPPLRGDTVIAYQWIKYLAENQHQIDLVSFSFSIEKEEILPIELTSLLNSAYLVHVSRLFSLLYPLRVLKYLLGKSPSSFARYDWSSLKRTVKNLPKSEWDIVILVGPNLANLASFLETYRCARIFIPYDAFSLEAQRRLYHERSRMMQMHYRIQKMVWERIEKDLFPRFDGCVVVSDVEKEAIASRWGNDVRQPTVIPNSVSKDLLGFERTESSEPSIVFSGSMEGLQSTDAVLYFYENVYGHLKKRFPTIKWVIVGRKPSHRIRLLATQDSSVVITGYVDDIRSAVGQGWVYICPVRIGTGIKNRLLEGMALGMPCVVSPMCCSALNIEHGVHLFEARDDEEYASCIIRLLEDHALRKSIGASARSFIAENYSVCQVGSQIDLLLSSLREERI